MHSLSSCASARTSGTTSEPSSSCSAASCSATTRSTRSSLSSPRAASTRCPMADGSSSGPREGVSDEWDGESYDERVLHRDPIAVENWPQQLAPLGYHDNGLE